VILDASGPGPGLFPMIEGIALVCLSAVLTVGSVARLRAGEAPIGDWRLSIRPLATWAVLMASALLLDVLGFYIGFALVTFFVASVMYRRSIAIGLATAIGCTVGLYLLFTMALDVRLPTGWLGF
jgi:hypothetical protein